MPASKNLACALVQPPSTVSTFHSLGVGLPSCSAHKPTAGRGLPLLQSVHTSEGRGLALLQCTRARGVGWPSCGAGQGCSGRGPRLTMCAGDTLQSLGLGLNPTLPNSTWASEVKQKRAKSSAACSSDGVSLGGEWNEHAPGGHAASPCRFHACAPETNLVSSTLATSRPPPPHLARGLVPGLQHLVHQRHGALNAHVGAGHRVGQLLGLAHHLQGPPTAGVRARAAAAASAEQGEGGSPKR